MEKIEGFEIVEQFLNNWKKECSDWYKEQLVKYNKSKEEYERKYTKLVNDVFNITENVEKADLHIGSTNNIEGFIEGKKSKCELWSTLSGGVVQCLHFRFYCKRR